MAAASGESLRGPCGTTGAATGAGAAVGAGATGAAGTAATGLAATGAFAGGFLAKFWLEAEGVGVLVQPAIRPQTIKSDEKRTGDIMVRRVKFRGSAEKVADLPGRTQLVMPLQRREISRNERRISRKA